MTASSTIPLVALRDSRAEGYPKRQMWAPVKISRAEIEQTFADLEGGSADDGGRREAFLVHPQAPAGVRGLAPATQVVLGVLLPGETTVPIRDNSNGLGMCLAGDGQVRLGDRTMHLSVFDVWTKPTMRVETFANAGPAPLRYLRYSNAALLESISAYYSDSGDTSTLLADVEAPTAVRAKDLAPAIPLASGGQLLPYEHLVNPDYVEDVPLHFAWNDVKQHLSGVVKLTNGYTGRPLLVLYNPATGRLNGTTPSFFATIAAFDAKFDTGQHRHMSSAINYHFAGRGYSLVEGERIDWEAGDLMLSAPGWGAHGHYISSDGARILTVQDHPLHISAGSLVWQEDLEGGPILTLGSQAGFETNLAEFRDHR